MIFWSITDKGRLWFQLLSPGMSIAYDHQSPRTIKHHVKVFSFFLFFVILTTTVFSSLSLPPSPAPKSVRGDWSLLLSYRNPYHPSPLRLESMKETRNFKLNDLSAQIKHWKKQHTLQVMQKVFWYCATLGIRPIIAKYGWQTWNILGKRWKVLNNLYTWPLILHIFVYRCCALF